MNTKETKIYIVESRYLAAQYIAGLFDRSGIRPKIIDSNSVGGCRQPMDSDKCLLILDRPNLASAVLSWGLKLRSCFPNSYLIVIADREFGVQVQKIFQRWIAAVVDYGDLAQLPCVVANALKIIPAERIEKRPCTPCDAKASGLEEAHFSRRQMEILELVCMRLSNKEIANMLNVEAATVKFHISNIFAKMGLRRRRELFAHVDALLAPPGRYIEPGHQHGAEAAYQ